MENLNDLTKEQLIEKVNQLEEKNRKLDGELYWANLKVQKCDKMERVLTALGVVFELYNGKQ